MIDSRHDRFALRATLNHVVYLSGNKSNKPINYFLHKIMSGTKENLLSLRFTQIFG